VDESDEALFDFVFRGVTGEVLVEVVVVGGGVLVGADDAVGAESVGLAKFAVYVLGSAVNNPRFQVVV